VDGHDVLPPVDPAWSRGGFANNGDDAVRVHVAPA